MNIAKIFNNSAKKSKIFKEMTEYLMVKIHTFNFGRVYRRK